MVDKSSIFPLGHRDSPVKIELGCGSRKRHPDFIGVDIRDGAGVDIVGDAVEVLRQFPEHSATEICSYHFLEHVSNVDDLLDEACRVLVPKGLFRCVCPHFSNPYFYSDPTHRSFFGLYTFAYFAETKIFRRAVPNYCKRNLELIDVKLVLKSDRRFPLRYAMKHCVGWLVNVSRGTQEFYEENLCWTFPCYEVAYTLMTR